ncbi:molybdate ABC transporter substrate-binding protein [Lampropedia cohaerens]|uniref:molybdate ABC transporter substrate-binding protein n=1 Tax=Lampropedia cohaerens TaxID=1610491 RepID=UPI0012E3842A|nr:molybdate ABC transporter substrate-binding protein [Lampropedia cohaerens]
MHGKNRLARHVRAHAAVLTWAAVSLMAAHSAQADTITVSAAASLTDAFKEIAQLYETQHPQDQVDLNFGASGTLYQQIDKGAPVDVFASADEATMDKAEAAGHVLEGTRQTFVKNTLVLIQPAGSAAALDSLQALQGEQVQRIAVGNPDSVPVGRYTKAALEAAGQWQSLLPKVIQTQNVRQSLDYVARGEVDAGFVYGSDAALMKDKVKVSFTVPVQTPVTYPIAVIQQGGHAEAAKRFIATVTSSQGQEILARYGFQPAVD